MKSVEIWSYYAPRRAWVTRTTTNREEWDSCVRSHEASLRRLREDGAFRTRVRLHQWKCGRDEGGRMSCLKRVLRDARAAADV
jgi:hypothetical protein